MIPIELNLDQPGEVTLVIEDADGKRVRNLISQEPMAAGKHSVMWDGLDDLQRDPEAANHSTFHIPGKLVDPGKYTVRGLVHPPIDVVYRMTRYSNGNPPWRTTDHASEWLTNHSAPSDVIFLPAGIAPEREGKPNSKEGQVLICSRVAEGGSGLAWVDLTGQKLWGQHWLGGVWTAASHMAVDKGGHPVPGVYAYASASWQGDKYNDYKTELRLHQLVDPEHRGKAPKDQRFGTGEDRPVLGSYYKLPLIPTAPTAPEIKNTPERELKEYYGKYSPELSGMAVHNGLVVSSFEKIDQLIFISAHEKEVVGKAEIAAPRGLAFDPQGRLYVISGRLLLRYSIDPEKPSLLENPETLVRDLLDPQYVMIAPDGDFYISDWGDSHQVKHFAADGTALKPIGDAGAPKIGKYNPNHMNHPAGMAIDDRGRIWVAENSHIPKRVSVWNLEDGTLADAFYGPMRYGGSGAVDPKNSERFFYDDDHGGTITFELDYKTGKSAPTAIPYLARYDKTGLIGRYTGAPPSYPLYHGEQLYLTDAYSLHTTGRRMATLHRYDNDGICRIVAAAGDINDSSREILPAFQRPEIQARMPEGFKVQNGQPLIYLWSDGNGNQMIEAEEVEFLDPASLTKDAKGSANLGTVSVTDDLAFTFSRVGDSIIRFSPVSIGENGVPAYSIAKREILATGAQSPVSSGGDQVLPAKDGWLITTTPLEPFAQEGLGGALNGEPTWSYPSLWPGLHASHIAPLLEKPGQIIGTTRVIGTAIDAPAPSDAGQLWAINSNKGVIYVFTTDGLFVARLFADCRVASWNVTEAKLGMIVNDMSLQEECFGPTWTATEDGKVWLQAYFTGNIIEIDHLEKIRRLPDQSIEITGDQLLSARQAYVEAEAKRQQEENKGDKGLTISPRTGPVELDGKADEWPEESFVEIDKRRVKVGNWGKREVDTRASVALHGDTLYAVWQGYDKDLLDNRGDSLNNLFKTGGCLDLMISTDPDADPARRQPVEGDQRLLITKVGDKTTAVRYEPVSPDATEAEGGGAVEFGSPLRTISFDRVQVVSDRVKLVEKSVTDLEADKNGSIVRTTYEIAIPLDLLDFKPEIGKSYKFDIGVLRGDGVQTLQRVYWKNRAAGIVSDIPSEAELIPALWGNLNIGD